MGDKLLLIYINDKKQPHHLESINTMRSRFIFQHHIMQFDCFFKVANISNSENRLLI